jgi:hypothetical protein
MERQSLKRFRDYRFEELVMSFLVFAVFCLFISSPFMYIIWSGHLDVQPDSVDERVFKCLTSGGILLMAFCWTLLIVVFHFPLQRTGNILRTACGMPLIDKSTGRIFIGRLFHDGITLPESVFLLAAVVAGGLVVAMPSTVKLAHLPASAWVGLAIFTVGICIIRWPGTRRRALEAKKQQGLDNTSPKDLSQG